MSQWHRFLAPARTPQGAYYIAGVIFVLAFSLVSFIIWAIGN